MSIITGIFNSLGAIWPKKRNGEWWYALAGNGGSWGEVDPLKSFLEIPEINAVINLKARVFSQGVVRAFNVKTGEEIPNDKFVEYFKKPNWFQTQAQFTRQSKVYREIFGNEYLYGVAPVGMPERLKQLYTIPPEWVNVKYKSDTLFFLEAEQPKGALKYWVQQDNSKIPLELDNLIHNMDNNIDGGKGNKRNKGTFCGISKLSPLSVAVNNMRMAYETRGVLLKNRGAVGILSNAGTDVSGTIPLDSKEVERVQEEYKKRYGALEGQSALLITSANLKYQQMAIPPDKLGLFQEIEEDFNKVLDAYHVPAELFVRSKGATYENQKQARKGLYAETIIPEAVEWLEPISNKYYERSDGNVRLMMDYSHLPVFQEDVKTKAESLGAAIRNLSLLLSDKQITQDEYRVELMKLGIGDGAAIPPPTDNSGDAKTLAAQAELRGSVGGVQGIIGIQGSVSRNEMTRESAQGILEVVYGFSPEQAQQILGPEVQAQPSNQNTSTNGEE